MSAVPVHLYSVVIGPTDRPSLQFTLELRSTAANEPGEVTEVLAALSDRLNALGDEVQVYEFVVAYLGSGVSRSLEVAS